MRLLICVLLCLIGLPVEAQVIRVQSGEHGTFTRLAMVFPSAQEWRLGRNEDGYALELKQGTLTFDLSDVFDLIDRKRLRSIWLDPETGWLNLGIGCDCHAIGFEANPRTLVIDIRDGAPTVGSAFEMAMDTSNPLPPLTQSPPPRPRSRPLEERSSASYSWLEDQPTSTASSSAPSQEANMFSDALRREDMQKMLTEELGRKATSGVIQLSPVPVGQDRHSEVGQELGGLAGLALSDESRSLGVDGRACPTPPATDLGSWSTEGDAFQKISAARGKVLGEFDAPSLPDVQEAARVYIFFGFGAEARNLVSQFASDQTKNDLLIALSWLVEGETPFPNPFEGLESCEGSAALWALLAQKAGTPLPGLNKGGVVQTFSALPKSLRQSLGPDVHDRLVALGDMSSANMVRLAALRAGEDGHPAEPILEASNAMALGLAEEAEAAIGTLDPKEKGLDALILLSDARFEQRKALESKDLLALESHYFELGSNHSKAARMRQSLARMRALSGDFTGALDMAADNETLGVELLRLMVELGADGILLERVAEHDASEIGKLPEAVRQSVGKRLLELGIADLAIPWLDGIDKTAEADIRLALDRDDVGQLEAWANDKALPLDTQLRETVLMRTGRFSQLAEHRAQIGDVAGAEQARRWAGQWDGGAQTKEGEPWAAVLDVGKPAPSNASTAGSLEEGRSLLLLASETHKRVSDLVQATRLTD